MAEILLASHKSIAGFEKLVVIKRILPNLAGKKRIVEMFLDEARIAAQLNHPNVIQIFDLGRISGRYFIAMEYLSGESLSMLIKSCRRQRKMLPSHLTAGIIMQAAEGLQHAHTMTGSDGKPLGIIHRDVSPQNIFVLYDGGVKVVDFGIAKAADRSTRTRTGTLKGKYAYMSPEQVEGAELDPRSDVFSLGIVLWECLVGRKLFRQENDLQLLKAIVGEDAPSPREVNPDVPEQLSGIAVKALARRREERYQSAAELRNALAAYLKSVHEDADTVAVGRFMQDLFRERIEKKRAIIEGARKLERDLGDKLFGDLEGYISDTEVSVPRSSGPTGVSRDELARPRRVWPVAGATLLIVAIGLLGWYLLPRERAVEVMGHPAVVVLPAGDAGVDAGPTKKPEPGRLDGGIATASVAPPADGADGAKTVADRRRRSPGGRKHKRPVAVVKRKPRSGTGTRKQAGKRSPPPRPGPPGKLRLVTTPWSDVYYRGRKLGQTPLIDVVLPSGKIKLRVVNKQAGIDREIVVTIKAGEKNVYRRNLY